MESVATLTAFSKTGFLFDDRNIGNGGWLNRSQFAKCDYTKLERNASYTLYYDAKGYLQDFEPAPREQPAGDDFTPPAAGDRNMTIAREWAASTAITFASKYCYAEPADLAAEMRVEVEYLSTVLLRWAIEGVWDWGR